MNGEELSRLRAALESERRNPASGRSTRASDHDLDVVVQELDALQAWLEAGAGGPVPVRPRQLVRRVVDSWSLTVPLSTSLVALARQLEDRP